MRVYLFWPRFHDAIRAGTKRQTIRGRSTRNPKPGDRLSLRGWAGRPYHSRQVELVAPVGCARVTPIEWVFSRATQRVRLAIGGDYLVGRELDALALADGFASLADFRDYQLERGRAAFAGLLIEWTPAIASGDVGSGETSGGSADVHAL